MPQTVASRAVNGIAQQHRSHRRGQSPRRWWPPVHRGLINASGFRFTRAARQVFKVALFFRHELTEILFRPQVGAMLGDQPVMIGNYVDPGRVAVTAALLACGATMDTTVAFFMACSAALNTVCLLKLVKSRL